MFLHLLAKRTPNEQFAPAAERRPYRLWQIRRALNAIAGVILAVSLFYSANQLMTHFELATTNSMLQSEVDLGKRHYNAMLQGLPPVPISYDSLRTLTDRYEALARRSPGPEPLFVHISRALNKSPKIELTRLDWSVADRPDTVPAGTTNSTGPVVAAPTGGSGFAVVKIQAQLPLSMASDHRTQLEAVNAFAETLRTPDIEVRVLTFPFETESGKSIKSSEATSLVDPPRFAISMAGKL
jgi:hypothetical protein